MALRIARINEVPQDEDQDLFGEYVAAKQAVDQAQNHLKKVQKQLIDQMGAKHQKSWSITKDGEQHTVTYVQSNSVVIDTKALRRALTAKVYDKYTTKELNKDALEEAMSQGMVDPMVVAKYVSEKPGNPYLRYTRKQAEDE